MILGLNIILLYIALNNMWLKYLNIYIYIRHRFLELNLIPLNIVAGIKV